MRLCRPGGSAGFAPAAAAEAGETGFAGCAPITLGGVRGGAHAIVSQQPAPANTQQSVIQQAAKFASHPFPFCELAMDSSQYVGARGIIHSVRANSHLTSVRRVTIQ